jgi:hypothetical protein
MVKQNLLDTARDTMRRKHLSMIFQNRPNDLTECSVRIMPK